VWGTAFSLVGNPEDVLLGLTCSAVLGRYQSAMRSLSPSYQGLLFGDRMCLVASPMASPTQHWAASQSRRATNPLGTRRAQTLPQPPLPRRRQRSIASRRAISRRRCLGAQCRGKSARDHTRRLRDLSTKHERRRAGPKIRCRRVVRMDDADGRGDVRMEVGGHRGGPRIMSSRTANWVMKPTRGSAAHLGEPVEQNGRRREVRRAYGS